METIRTKPATVSEWIGKEVCITRAKSLYYQSIDRIYGKLRSIDGGWVVIESKGFITSKYEHTGWQAIPVCSIASIELAGRVEEDVEG